MKDLLNSLTEQLEERLDIIADRKLYERDPETHLQQLRNVSLRITGTTQQLKGKIGPRLQHFLDSRSYEKALDYIRTMEDSGNQ